MTEKPKARKRAVKMNDNESRKAIAKILATVGGMDEKLDAVCEEVKDHRTILHGPPTNGNSPGLKTRMDRQEQFRSRVIWAAGIGLAAFTGAVGTILGLAGETIWNCLFNH